MYILNLTQKIVQEELSVWGWICKTTLSVPLMDMWRADSLSCVAESKPGRWFRTHRLTAGDVSAASAREPIIDLLIIHPLRGRLPVICPVAPDTNSPRGESHDVGMLWYCEHASVGLMPCRLLSVSLCCRVRLWKRVYWVAWDVCHKDCVVSVCRSVGWCVFLHHIQSRTCPQYFTLRNLRCSLDFAI